MIWNDPMLWPKKAQKVTLTLMGNGSDYDISGGCYIEIAGTRYYSAGEIEVNVGTEILCYAAGLGSSWGTILLNGVIVVDSFHAKYTFTTSQNTIISLSVGNKASTITITESTDIAAGGAIGN